MQKTVKKRISIYRSNPYCARRCAGGPHSRTSCKIWVMCVHRRQRRSSSWNPVPLRVSVDRMTLSGNQTFPLKLFWVRYHNCQWRRRRGRCANLPPRHPPISSGSGAGQRNSSVPFDRIQFGLASADCD